MRTEIPFSELRVGEQGDAAFRSLIEAARAPVNGELHEMDALIQECERRRGISSDAMRAAVARGDMDETPDVCVWLMLLNRRDRIAKRKARAH